MQEKLTMDLYSKIAHNIGLQTIFRLARRN